MDTLTLASRHQHWRGIRFCRCKAPRSWPQDTHVVMAWDPRVHFLPLPALTSSSPWELSLGASLGPGLADNVMMMMTAGTVPQ